MKTPFVIAISSVSGGGKTTITKNLCNQLNNAIAFYIDGEQVTQLNLRPYRYKFIVVEAKDYEIFCKVITHGGLELITDAVCIKANKPGREILEE